MKPSKSLKYSWTIIIALAVIVPVMIVMFWYGWTMYKHQLNSALVIERQANELIQNRIESEIKRYKTLLNNKSDSLSLLIDKPGDSAVLQEINSMLSLILKREPAVHEVLILSSNAEVIADVDFDLGIMGDRLLSPDELKAVAIRAGFDKTDAYPEVVIPLLGRVYIGSPEQHDNTFVFSIAVPIGVPAKAVLVMLIDVDKLWLTDELHTEHGIGTEVTRDYMLDRRGVLLTTIKDSEYIVGDLMTHLAIVRTALINDEWLSDISYLGVIKQSVYGTLTTIPSLNWALVSEVSVFKIIKPILFMLMEMFLMTLLGMVVFIGVVLRFANKTLQPIQHACKAIDQVAKGDYKVNLKSSGIYELDVMASGIMLMTNLREQAENALRASEQDLIITLNSIGDAVITTDAEGQITRMNPIAEQLTGWVLKQAKGQPLGNIFTIINASTREPISNPIDKVLLTGETVYLNNHTTLIAKDGKEYQIADSAAPIRNEDNKVLGIVLVFNDVTEQYQIREQARQVQQALFDKEKELREMLNSMVDAVISIDEHGVILSFNKSAESLFGYGFEQITGRNISCLMPEPFTSSHDGYLQHYMKTGEAHIIGMGREVQGLHKNGNVFPMRIFVAELPKGIDGKRRFIGSCQDLTQLKQQEEQLRRSQKMDALGKLTGGIAHDYNNMLGVIMGYARLLEKELTDRPKLTAYAKRIHHAGERGAKLTKKLLSFSQQETPEAIRLDINALLNEQQDMLQKTLTVRIKLLIELADGVWPICVDNNDLEDAILNICINAMHAMSDAETAPQLNIHTCNQSLSTIEATLLGLKVGDYVLLSISDTGRGMDEATKEKIFDPFFSTKGKQGTGLGLSQVFGFVTRSSGAIKVYTEQGRGSKFLLYFPRSFIDSDEVTDVKRDIEDLRGQEKILVVDDETDLRELATEILSQQGYQVLCAENGKQALEILATNPINLVLSDIIMPGMDGYQLAAIIQQKYPAIKIQLVSGFSDNRHEHTADESLYKTLLEKPYDAHVMLKQIRFLLDS